MYKGTDPPKHGVIEISYDKNGYCFDRKGGRKIPLNGFENDCHVADIVANFYLARTAKAGSVRMDPMFDQKGHREWFIDSIGKLRIAMYVCSTHSRTVTKNIKKV